MYPRLKATIALPPQGADSAVCLRLGQRAFDIEVPEGEPNTFFRLLGLLNGGFAIEKIAELLGLRVDLVRSTLDQLVAAGLVYDYSDPSAPRTISKDDVLFSVAALTSAYRCDMFRHPLFAKLAGSEMLFLATSIEYGHIIRDASRHIGKALKFAPDHLQDLLKTYLASEENHYLALENSLSIALSLDFRFDNVEKLASTEALLLKTHDLAVSDLLAYIACCAAFEAERIPESSQSFHWGTATAGVYEVLRDHAAEDCHSAHSTLFEKALSSIEWVDANAVVAVCDSLHTYKHYFDNLNHEILRVYSCDNLSLPRLKSLLADFVLAQ